MEAREARSETVDWRNPFKQAWNLQKDGDAWELAWRAIVCRGAAAQTLRKVKGHATEEDVRQGKCTEEDRQGNDEADTAAKQGLLKNGGAG